MNNNQYMDPMNSYQPRGSSRGPGKGQSNAVIIILIVLIAALAAVGGLAAYKIFKDRSADTSKAKTNVDISSLIRARTSEVKRKDISVSADDLLSAAGISPSNSNYAEMQQAAQSFVDSLNFTTVPSTGDLTDYAGQEIEVKAKGTPAQIENVQKKLGIELSGLNYKKRVIVESGLSSSSNGDRDSSGDPYDGNSNSSDSSDSSDSADSADSSGSTDSDSDGSPDSNSSDRYTSSSIRSASGILGAGVDAGESAVKNATGTNMANHSGSANKSAFSGSDDRWTDPEIETYATYFGRGKNGTDLLACFYRVTMYDNDNEEYVTSYEGASCRGITENTSAADVRDGMDYDGYYNADDGGVSSLVSWYESHYGVTMTRID